MNQTDGAENRTPDGPDRPGPILRRGDMGGVPWVLMPDGLNTGVNGYVQIPEGHPWRGRDVEDVPLSAHGGLTYSDDRGWVGFDTGHAGDFWTDDALAEVGLVVPEELEDFRARMRALSSQSEWRMFWPSVNWTIGLLADMTAELAQDVWEAFPETTKSGYIEAELQTLLEGGA